MNSNLFLITFVNGLKVDIDAVDQIFLGSKTWVQSSPRNRQKTPLKNLKIVTLVFWFIELQYSQFSGFVLLWGAEQPPL